MYQCWIWSSSNNKHRNSLLREIGSAASQWRCPPPAARHETSGRSSSPRYVVTYVSAYATSDVSTAATPWVEGDGPGRCPPHHRDPSARHFWLGFCLRMCAGQVPCRGVATSSGREGAVTMGPPLGRAAADMSSGFSPFAPAEGVAVLGHGAGPRHALPSSAHRTGAHRARPGARLQEGRFRLVGPGRSGTSPGAPLRAQPPLRGSTGGGFEGPKPPEIRDVRTRTCSYI